MTYASVAAFVRPSVPSRVRLLSAAIPLTRLNNKYKLSALKISEGKMPKIALVLLVVLVVMLGCTASAPQPTSPAPISTPSPGSTGFIGIATSMDNETWLGDVSYTITGPRKCQQVTILLPMKVVVPMERS